MSEFEELGFSVFGVSTDEVKKHEKFSSRLGLKYPLLSDPDRELIETLGFWQKKKMYGKEYMGVVRSTLVVDPERNVRAMWDQVKVKGHVEEVLKRCRELAGK
ncbi:MAG: peroxiredoxin [Synergistales bacterium]|nr:peroxiredoxin [Synergistales bacterium]